MRAPHLSLACLFIGFGCITSGCYASAVPSRSDTFDDAGSGHGDADVERSDGAFVDSAAEPDTFDDAGSGRGDADVRRDDAAFVDSAAALFCSGVFMEITVPDGECVDFVIPADAPRLPPTAWSCAGAGGAGYRLRLLSSPGAELELSLDFDAPCGECVASVAQMTREDCSSTSACSTGVTPFMAPLFATRPPVGEITVYPVEPRSGTLVGRVCAEP